MLMVSRIPYPHVVNQVFRGHRTLRHLVGIIFSFVAIMIFRDWSVSIVCVTFVLYGPLRYAWEKAVQRRHLEESIF
jgi:CDP-diacylglycerol--serine O-phosphatidyltransferase